ncbi:MAG: 30S ribosomal protein S12 methylthiotransferase RimO [Deltaproteobacteria bacterium]|nr:30S ribosomal protein S12 methylthiotransferase RimO [Deltaproteobacteria bacterium]
MSTAQAEKISVNFISLGCPKNLVDSEVMMGLLDRDDFNVVPADQRARVSVINTCSFVDDSKQESIDAILEVADKKKSGDTQMIIVAGCLAQRYVNELPELLPEVDIFVGTGEYHKLPGIIRHKLAGQKNVAYVEKPEYVPDHLTPRMQSTPAYTKYVKIAEGCSHRCSFCIIPHLRGDLHSRTPDDVFNEIKEGVERGVKEFNLVSQDLNEYGRDRRDLEIKPSLYGLLDDLQKLDGEFWLRLMYMYPLQFPDKLVQLIAEHPHIAKYVDIPLQHISDHMLKKMNRGSSSRYIYRLIENLKKSVPGIVLRTTFISGHPGENKEDHEELKQFLKDMEFDRVGIFKFSREEGTAAYDMNAQVPEEIKEERHAELMAMQQKISQKKNQSYVGKTIRVLFEGVSEETELLHQGRFYGQAPDIDGVVLINDGKGTIGEFCDVKITEALPYDLLGEIVS